VLKTALVLGTVVSCVIAGLQLSGRVLLSFSDALTPRVNMLLQPYRIEVVDLSGDWRGFNPVVRAGYVGFAAGEMRDVEVELDFFSSLLSDDLVFAHAYVMSGQVGLIHTSAGWQLQGAQEQPLNIDFVGLAQNTRSADARVRVSFEREGVTADYDVAFNIDNDEQNVRLAASIASPTAASSQRKLSIFLTRHQVLDPGSDSHSMPHVRLGVQGDLQIAPGLLGSTGLALTVSEGSWLESESGDTQTLGTGRLSAEISVVESPLVKVGTTPRFAASVDVQRLGQKFFGRLQSALSAGDRAPLSLPEVSFLLNADELMSALGMTAAFNDVFAAEDLLAKAVVENIELGPITRLGNDVLVPETILGEWVAGLNVRGHVERLVAYYDEQLGFGFTAQARELELSAYRGSPSFTNTDADIFGDLQHIGMSVSGRNVTMEFPSVFSGAWFFEQVQGQLMLLFRPGYASVRGKDIEAYSGISLIKGGFATSRPSSREEQRFTLGLTIDRILTGSTDPYLPRRLSDGLRQWLQDAPRSGELMDVAIAHHGQIHLLPGNRSRRRFEMTTNFQNAEVKFTQDWPPLLDAAGKVHVAGPITFGTIDRGTVARLDLDGANVRVEPGRATVFLDLASKATGSALLNLIRATPLQQSLSFVSPQWTAEGEVSYAAEIAVPLGGALGSESGLKVDLSVDFDSLDLNMPEYRLAWKNLAGRQTFSLPHHLQGEVIGELFDESVRVDVSHDPENLRFGFQGQMAADDIFYLADMQPNSVLSGEDYLEGELTLTMNGSGDSQLRVDTDLRGFAVDLPAQFGKPEGVLKTSEFLLTFGADHQKLDWRYGLTKGRVFIPEQGSVRGAVGLSAQPIDVAADYEGFVVSGKLDRVDLADWVSVDGAPAVQTPFNWQIRELDVGELVINELTFPDVSLSAQSAPDLLVFQVQGQDIDGSVDLSDSGRAPQIDLLKLRLPALYPYAETFLGNVDPIDLSTGRALPRAEVFIDRLYLGDEAFGRWKFDIVPEQDAVRFDIDDVLVNGVGITDSVLRWDLRHNVSAFSGSVDVEDLAKTLPLWGYAPVATTTTASVSGNLSWAGSPANIDIAAGEGALSLAATDGRFFDVETPSPGLRAVSLLNITALTKRISLDFSDVVGEGISFEQAAGTIQLEDRKLTFTENLVIESTSSRYELGGMADLRNDRLDAQMIVTLPVSDSLPWYAAYLALANPVAGIGLAVGERVFRKPIERMSSAKFAVSGELSNPNVVFIDLFNQDIAVADAGDERLSPNLLKDQEAEGRPDQTDISVSPISVDDTE
jgi:uncharacterized protein YhdP